MALSLWTCTVTLYWMLATPYLLLLPAPVQMQHWPFKQGAEPKRVFLCISKKSRPYCEIISVRGNPCSWLPWITLAHEFTNLWIIICSIFIKIFLITLPKKLHSHEPVVFLASHQHWQKWFHSSHEMKVADDRNSANVCWNINTIYLICICGSY